MSTGKTRSMRRLLLRAMPAVMVVGAGVLGYAVAGRADEPAARIIKVSAKRFVFVPNQLTLKKGETVEIELGSEDVPMGFSAPDFALRSDIIPGQTTRVKFTPQKVGTYTFLCDIFCGSGHESMDGTLTVVE